MPEPASPPRYFEDFAVGDARTFGHHTVSKDEILEFARRYDPQPFHTDEEAARRHQVGGLIASGWHTAAITMRLLVEGMLRHTENFASPGVDEVRWRLPVRPGDTLSVRSQVVETRPSRSKPDRGLVRTLHEALNQDGDVVMSWIGMSIIRRRPAAGDPSSPATEKGDR